jgi:hypothetical protein
MAGRPFGSYQQYNTAQNPARGKRIRSRLQAIAGHASQKKQTSNPVKIAHHETEIDRLRDEHRRDLAGLLP